MLCVSPITVSVKGHRHDVRCYHCVGCRLTRRDEWAARILMENQLHAHSRFLTLTYGDAAIESGLVSNTYRDVQLFLKRYRKQTGESVRFFVSGERGPATGRLHWHMILFGCRPWSITEKLKQSQTMCHPNNRLLCELWPFGFLTVGAFFAKRARYTAKYTMKDADAIMHCSRDPKLGSGFLPILAPILKMQGYDKTPPYIQIGKTWYPLAASMREICDKLLDAPTERHQARLASAHIRSLGIAAFGDPKEEVREVKRQRGLEEMERLHGQKSKTFAQYREKQSSDYRS